MSVRSASRLFAFLRRPLPPAAQHYYGVRVTFITYPLFLATRQNPVRMLPLFQDTVCSERTAAQQTISGYGNMLSPKRRKESGIGNELGLLF